MIIYQISLVLEKNGINLRASTLSDSTKLGGIYRCTGMVVRYYERC